MKVRRVGLGEREVIARFARRFSQAKRKLPMGFDDDVSAYPISPKNWLILKTDTLVGSTDVPPGMSLEEASRKAVVATVSDFAAKGVQPVGVMISLALPAPVQPKMVTELVNGIYRATREYRCELLGGDTGESRDLIIDCIGFGIAPHNKVIRRDGARAGDIIAVTGQFGKTTAGLKILLSKNRSLAKEFSGLVDSVLHPVARLETGLRLARSGMVSSSIDSSDGLAWSLHEIGRASNVRMVLERIPLAAEAQAYAMEQGLDGDDMGLYGGEEYELVMTIKKESFPSLKRIVPSLIRVGRVQEGHGLVFSPNGELARRIEPRGWEHMISRDWEIEECWKRSLF